MQDSKEKILSWIQLSSTQTAFDDDYQYASRDVFQAKLDGLYQETKNPLLVAVVGEIGNNAFDHNLGNWRDVAGLYFRNFEEKKLIILADRGQGVTRTLGRIVPDLKSDKRALEIAFIEIISGRSPEQRGNGLKFVALAVKENNWRLSFYSGKAFARIDKGEISFTDVSQSVNGCLAIIEY